MDLKVSSPEESGCIVICENANFSNVSKGNYETKSSNMRMKMWNAELYLKRATAIYAFSKITRTTCSVKVKEMKLPTSLKAFILLIPFPGWVLRIALGIHIAHDFCVISACTLACVHTSIIIGRWLTTVLPRLSSTRYDCLPKNSKGVKVHMTWKCFSAYFKGLSKYRRMMFFFLKYLF